MLNPVAFASSLTILTGALYLLLFLLAVVWREAFRFLVDAQVSRCRRGVATPAGSLGGWIREHVHRDHRLRVAVRLCVEMVVQRAGAENVEGQILRSHGSATNTGWSMTCGINCRRRRAIDPSRSVGKRYDPADQARRLEPRTGGGRVDTAAPRPPAQNVRSPGRRRRRSDFSARTPTSPGRGEERTRDVPCRATSSYARSVTSLSN